MLGPSPTGAYILLRLRHARHCRPGARLHPRLPSQARDRPPPLRPRDSSLPSSTRVRKRVARLPPANSLFLRTLLALSHRPSCRPPQSTSLAAKPTPPPLPSVNDDSVTPPGAENSPSITAAPARVSLSYVTTAITFAGKSSGAARVSGLTLQGAVRSYSEISLPLSPLFLLLLFFFTFSFVRGSREILSRKSIR